MHNFLVWFSKINVWEWTAAAILVILLLAITDVPPSIFNFFIRLLKLKDIKIDESHYALDAKLPTNKRKLPIAAFIESKFKIKYADVRDNYIYPLLKTKKNSISWLIKKLDVEENKASHSESIDIHFETFPSRSKNQALGDQFITILSGLPGTGKSTKVINWLETRLSEKKMDFLIYFNAIEIRSRFPMLLSAPSNNTDELFWKNILYSVNKNSVDEFKRPSPNLISYYINYRHCYLLIDDIDNKGELDALIELILNYFKTYHRRNPNLKIVITTRNQQISLPSAGLVTLDPLDKNEAESFFYKKCKEVGVDLNSRDFFDIIDQKHSLLHFENKYTQNPLFVEIVAFIIKIKGFNKLSDFFQKSVAFVYREFIKILCTKSGNEEFYEKFYINFRLLGYTTAKMNMVEFESGLIEQSFTSEINITTDFLNTNGLLIRRNELGKNLYSFIHLTIRDILYVDYIVANNKYDIFSGVNYIGEEFTYYFREEIKQINQYCELLKYNLLIAGEILNDDFIKKLTKENNTDFFIAAILNTILDHHVFDSRVQIDFTDIQKFIEKIPGSEKYLKSRLLQKVQSQTHLSERAINILIQIDCDLLKDFFISSILQNKCLNEFATLINDDNPNVVCVFKDILSRQNVNTQRQMQILLKFLLTAYLNKKNKYSTWFLSNIKYFSLENLKILFSEIYIRESILYAQYEYKDLNTVRLINKALVDHIWGSVFVPRGSYVSDGKTIINDKSFLVAIQPKKILIKAKNNYEAEMAALNSLSIKLMTFSQLDIVYQYFFKKDIFDPHSIIGIGDSSIKENILYEAYKENNYGKLHFAYLQSGSKAVSRQVHKDSSFIENIIYRNFEVL